MNIWSRKRAGRAPNVKDVAGFQVCLATFEDAADTCVVVPFCTLRTNVG